MAIGPQNVCCPPFVGFPRNKNNVEMSQSSVNDITVIDGTMLKRLVVVSNHAWLPRRRVTLHDHVSDRVARRPPATCAAFDKCGNQLLHFGTGQCTIGRVCGPHREGSLLSLHTSRQPTLPPYPSPSLPPPLHNAIGHSEPSLGADPPPRTLPTP